MGKHTKPLFRDQFGQFRRLTNDRKPLGLTNLRSLGSARRFSARLWRSGWGAQLGQQLVHPASHLLRRRFAVHVFPRMQLSLDQLACQNQMIVDNGYDVGPALELFRGSQTGLVPHQGLFIETIAMFLAEAQNIAQSYLHKIGCLISGIE
jgi:hypothetical protein